MKFRVSACLIVVGTFLLSPLSGEAQEATLSGTVTDSTGGVLPGVTVTAVLEASGNTFEGVTDERGAYRLAVRTGAYRITATLPGFATLSRSGLELLAGQQAVVNLQLLPSGVQETVTVTGEAPLIDISSSTLGGNIDPRQMQELPVNGRNWQDLVIMAPGSRTNAVDSFNSSPTPRERRDYQLNMDGQQVTQNLAGGSASNPLFSRDAIAEFQFVSSRFDATQGRSSGIQVNAITKSGTNAPGGSFSGYFRDDRFNAPDFIRGVVLPYSNQQLSATFGGPIRRDRVHFFANYEYEREPTTVIFTTPWPRFNLDMTGTNRKRMGGVRLDFQLSPQSRLMTRGNVGKEWRPLDNPVNHPASITTLSRHMEEIFTSLTQVLSNRTLNEVKVGFASFYFVQHSLTNWANHPQAANGITQGSPNVLLTGFEIGQSDSNLPQRLGQNVYSIRDDFTYSFAKGGRHDLKIGGEYLNSINFSFNCRQCAGIIDARGGPVPANIEDLFPVWDDVSTWNLAALTPITRTFQMSVGKFPTYQRRHTVAGWLQDDWTVNSRLTLNLGVRYDLITGAFAEGTAIPPFIAAGRPYDKNNIGPRLGFAFRVNDQTVLRGGGGLYYGEVLNPIASRTDLWAQVAGVEVLPDGRPDFAARPFNGPLPTYEQAVSRYCSTANVPGCLRRIIASMASPTAQIPYSYQSSIGMQRQIGTMMAFELDYSYSGARHESGAQGNVNLTFDPVTGANYPFSNIARRAYPDWGVLGVERMDSRSNYHGLQTAFTRRFSNRWQASGTYTLSGLWDGDSPPLSGLQQVTFPVAKDLGGDYSLAASDQRHRAVFNGIWEVGYGFQLSGLYFFGSGARFGSSYGGDLRQVGGGGSNRLRPNGTIVTRNNFVGRPLHRVDLRVQRRFSLGGRVAFNGILEAFNLFNHENYGSYTTAESNAQYGRPTQHRALAYQARMLQVGFRATF